MLPIYYLYITYILPIYITYILPILPIYITYILAIYYLYITYITYIYYLYRCWRWDGSRRSDSDGRAVLQAEERDGEVERLIFF